MPELTKDVWGVRGKPDQIGISKIKKDMYTAGKWVKKRYISHKRKKARAKKILSKIKI